MEATLRVDGRECQVTMQDQDGTYVVEVDGHAHRCRVQPGTPMRIAFEDGVALDVHVDPLTGEVRVDDVVADVRIVALQGVAGVGAGGAGSGQVRPPMTGKLVRLAVKPGDLVDVGDVLFVLEAMKMQNEVRSPVAGTVAAVAGAPGDALDTDRVVVEIEPA